MLYQIIDRNITPEPLTKQELILVNIGNEEKEEQFVENCSKRGARVVYGLKPQELLMSSAWDLMEDVLQISKETHSNERERFYAQEALMDIIGSTAIRVERDEIDYGVKLVIDEMARRVLWRMMRQ